MTRLRTGAQVFCDVLESEGVECVFGLPGTQTVSLYEALRHSALRIIVPTHELSAAFMAYGCAKSSGKVAVLLTIPGPGFAFAPAGLAEASLDGVPIVHFTLAPSRGPTGQPAFQAIDQAAIARPLVKAVLRVERRDEVPRVVRDALRLARQPGAGPVFVEMSDAALRASSDVQDDRATTSTASISMSSAESVDTVIDLVRSASHPVVFLASDCTPDADDLLAFATAHRTPIFVPPPSRGVVPEDHPWVLCCDDQRTRLERIQAVIDRADLIVVLGTRLTHIATAGFRLRLPPERVVCITDTAEDLPHGYTAHVTLRISLTSLLGQLRESTKPVASTWAETDVGAWQAQFAGAISADLPEPVVNGGTAAAFFADMRAALPRDVIVVTDSGLHQGMVRRHFPVFGTRGLIFPCELQSMAFGFPAAIGAKLAQPQRVVVVVMGDGGFAMSGMELLTVVRDDIPVIVVVFNDGQLNLIRLQQLREFGVAHGAALQPLDLERFAEAAGARYLNAANGVTEAFTEAVRSRSAVLIEVPVGDSPAIHRTRLKSYARESVRRAIGPSLVGWLKKRFR